MKCPIVRNEFTKAQGECGENQCAQWDKVSKQCYVLSDLELKRKILKELGKIATGVSVK